MAGDTITADQKDQIQRLWVDGMPYGGIADVVSVSLDTVQIYPKGDKAVVRLPS